MGVLPADSEGHRDGSCWGRHIVDIVKVLVASLPVGRRNGPAGRVGSEGRRNDFALAGHEGPMEVVSVTSSDVPGTGNSFDDCA